MHPFQWGIWTKLLLRRIRLEIYRERIAWSSPRHYRRMSNVPQRLIIAAEEGVWQTFHFPPSRFVDAKTPDRFPCTVSISTRPAGSNEASLVRRLRPVKSKSFSMMTRSPVVSHKSQISEAPATQGGSSNVNVPISSGPPGWISA